MLLAVAQAVGNLGGTDAAHALTPTSTCSLSSAVAGTLARISVRHHISCSAARSVASHAFRDGEPVGWTCQGGLDTLPYVLTCASATAEFEVRPVSVFVFRSADRGVECAVEPPGAVGIRPGLDCFAGVSSPQCDGEIITIAGVGAQGLAYPFRKGCTSGTPFDLGSRPTIEVVRPGHKVARRGVVCLLRRGDTMRCSNRSRHGFKIGPRIARRF